MRTLVIGDLHCPADHEDYLQFCLDMKRKYKTNNTVFIGDIIDHEAISAHDKNPSLPGPIDELAQAREGVRKWYNAFKNASVCIGNHDARVQKKAVKNGLATARREVEKAFNNKMDEVAEMVFIIIITRQNNISIL